MAGNENRYLITGAQGFVGRYLVAFLLSSNPEIEIFGTGRSSRLLETFTHSVQWGTRRVEAPLPGDLRDWCIAGRNRYGSVDLDNHQMLSRILREFEPGVVIHTAAGLRDDPPEQLFRTNVGGTINLLRAIAESGVALRKLVLCSSGGVYGAVSDSDLPLQESAPCLPVDMYSASKLASEHVSSILSNEYGLPAVWGRVFNIVGPGQDERHLCGRLASQAAAIVNKLVPPVIEVGRLDTTRDIIDVRDVARALACLVEKGAPGRTYNIGSGREISIQGVLEATLRLAGLTSSVRVLQKLAPRPEIQRHFADIRRMAALGFQLHYTLEQSVRDLLRYYSMTVSRSTGSIKDEQRPSILPDLGEHP
jgi:nucleoside-diphosphate-sugar epimerase